MTQTAKVTAILDDKNVMVEVKRQSACSHKCDECAGCATVITGVIKTQAKNTIGAEVGDMVVIESDSKKMLKLAALVYMLPIIAFILFYILFYFIYEPAAVFAGVLAFLAGIVYAIVFNRKFAKRNENLYNIISITNRPANEQGELC